MTYGVLTGRFGQRLAWASMMRAATLEAKASGVSAIHGLWACVRPRPAHPEEADTTARRIAIAAGL